MTRVEPRPNDSYQATGETPFWPSRWKRDSRIICVASWLLFSWFRLWQGTQAPILIWQDSKDYEAIGSQALWSSGFWFGGRPPLTPFLWKVTGSPDAFAMGQTLISIVSWGFLAWTVGSLFPAGWRRLVGFLVVLAFGTATPVVLWDRSVLSESLALSGLALLFAVSIRLVQRATPRRAAAVVGAALWCALARDTEIILPAILGLFILIFAIVRRDNPRKTLLVGTACGLFLAAGFCIATVVESGRDALNISDNLYVRVFPYPARVAWFAAHGMPEAKQIDELTESEPPPALDTAQTVVPDLTSPAYSRLSKWINTHGSTTYALWTMTHPWFVVLEPFRTPERTYNDAHGSIYGYAATNKVTSGLTPVLWPPWLWLLGMASATLVIADLRELETGRVAEVIVVLGLIGLLAMLVAWNGDGQEATRHTLEGLAEIRLGVLVTFLYVVLSPASASLTNGDDSPEIPATGHPHEEVQSGGTEN
jgi:hypothetical protein